MPAKLCIRHVRAVIAAASAVVAAPGIAQQWSVYSGAGSRIEYNDNYFFTVPGQTGSGNPTSTGDPESAFTLSLFPFVAASRRTEVSEVTALLAIGANKVWGPSPSEEYLSGTFSLTGTLREERSTWSGSASYTRSSNLEDVRRNTEIFLERTYTDSAALGGSYSYALSDRWSLGATAGGYANRYDSVEGPDESSDDRGFNVIGNVGYAFSDSTQLTYALGYTYYASDSTRSNVITTTLGVVHRFSPQLTVSGSAGGFWSDTTAKQALPGDGTPIAAGETRSDNGTFFGGSIEYAFAEGTQFGVRVSQGLAPSGTGTISKSENAGVALSHQFSDRLTGRLGASYVRTTFPVALDSSASDKTVSGQAGLSYQLAERWKLDAGYQYTRTRYSQVSGEPQSNLVFVSIAYNWPGASFTGWVGKAGDSQGLPGAGPISLPERPIGLPGDAVPSAPPSSQPFDAYTLP